MQRIASADQEASNRRRFAKLIFREAGPLLALLGMNLLLFRSRYSLNSRGFQYYPVAMSLFVVISVYRAVRIYCSGDDVASHPVPGKANVAGVQAMGATLIIGILLLLLVPGALMLMSALGLTPLDK